MFMQGSNSTCSVCSQATPALYCTCQGVKSFLCNKCVGDHTLKFPQFPHPIAPVAVDNVDFSAFGYRSKYLAEGKVELQRNLDAIDSCYNEFSTAVQSLIDRFQQLRNQWLQQLYMWKSQLKQDFDEAIAEVEMTILLDAPVLRAKYSHALRCYQGGQLPIFTYQIDVNGTWAGIESLIKASCSDNLRPNSYGSQSMQGMGGSPAQQYPPATSYAPVQYESPQAQQLLYSSTVQAGHSLAYSQTVQPALSRSSSVQIPASSYGSQQYYGVSLPQFPQAISPGISRCPACSKPFANEGGKQMYCSPACNPMILKTVVGPSAGNYKNCAMCGRYVANRPLKIPADLQGYAGFIDSVCSIDCLRKFKKVSEDQPPS